MSKGMLVAISAPSGGGKTTVIKSILEKNSSFVYSISMTTRSPRTGEVDGKDYFFVTNKEFEKAIQNNDLIEYEKVHDCYYGTPKTVVQNWLDQGKTVLLDIDVNGAHNIKRFFPDNSMLIFLKPPSVKELIERLTNRSTETQEQINLRMSRVEKEIADAEDFDHVLINDKLDETIINIENLIINKIK